MDILALIDKLEVDIADGAEISVQRGIFRLRQVAREMQEELAKLREDEFASAKEKHELHLKLKTLYTQMTRFNGNPAKDLAPPVDHLSPPAFDAVTEEPTNIRPFPTGHQTGAEEVATGEKEGHDQPAS